MTQTVATLTPTPFALAVRQPTVRVVPSGPHELCPGDSLQLSVENPNLAWTYTWSHGPTGPTAWVYQPGTYTVTVQGPLGCTVTSEPISVSALPAPAVSVRPASPLTICPGDSVRLVASPALSYQWFYEGLPLLGATDSVLAITQPGTYFVQAQQVCGTAESDPFVLLHHPAPTAYFVSQPPDSVEVGQPVTFIDSTQGGTAWQWIIGGQPFPGSPTLTYAFPRDTLYEITLISQNAAGCRDTFTKVLYVRPFSGIFIPTGFTPNGDGVNDLFLIVAPPLEWSRLRIYSRWGLLIREIAGTQWDGTDASGQLVPEDAYTFTFEGRLYSGQVVFRAGTVTVLR